MLDRNASGRKIYISTLALLLVMAVFYHGPAVKAAASSSVTSVATPANGTYRLGQSLDFTVNFDQPVSVTGTPQLGLTIGTDLVQANYESGSGSTALTFRYTVADGDRDSNGITVGSLSLNDGSIKNATDSEEADLTLNSVGSLAGVLVDGVRPTASLTSAEPSPTNKSTIRITITFSEPVTGLTTSSLNITNGSVNAVNGTATTYVADIVPASDGTLTIDLPANAVINQVGNGNAAAAPLSLVIDRTRPTVVITSAEASPTIHSNFSITAIFSEPVTGFAMGDISITNGTLSNLRTNDSQSYTADFTATAFGPITVNIGANAASDTAGNPSLAAAEYRNEYIAQQADLQAVLTVNQATPDIGDTVAITGTVTNNGPSSASNVEMNALLPAGLTFVSATPSQGSYNPTTGIWTVGTIAAGSSRTLSITAIVASSSPNTVTITVENSTPLDPIASNNAASISIAAGTPALSGMNASPTRLTRLGGNVLVTLTGSHLTGQTLKVYVDDLEAATATVSSATEATATVAIAPNSTSSVQTHALTVYLNGVKVAGQTANVTVDGVTLTTPTKPETPEPQRSLIDLNGISTVDPDTIDVTQPSVTLEVIPKNNSAFVTIPASALSGYANRNADFFLEIQTPYGSYRIPANLASLIPGLSDKLETGSLKEEDIGFKLVLANQSDNHDIRSALAKDLPSSSVMGPIVGVQLDIVNLKTGQTIGSVDKLNKPLTAILPIPNDVVTMPEQWGAFRYNDSTKQFEYVSARKIQTNGVWYATINSDSNGVMVVAENAVSFVDMHNHWAGKDVQLAAAKGLVDGVGEGKFDPNRSVTRAEFAAILVRALGRSASSDDAATYGDVLPGAWYYDDIAKASSLGLLDYASGDSFLPNEPLTREEMASMLAAAIALEQPSSTNGKVSLNGFKDIGSANSAYLKDIGVMVDLGIMSGIDRDKFDPTGNTTRAQAAVVCVRMLHTLGLID